MDYSDKDDVRYEERLSIVHWIVVSLLISSFISFYVVSFFLDAQTVSYIRQAMALIGMPLAAWVFITFKSITRFKKVQHMHGFGIGDIINWHGEPFQIVGINLLGIAVFTRFSIKLRTIPYSLLEESEVEHITPMGVNFGPKVIRGYVVSTHIDIINPKSNLNDLVLKRYDDDVPLPISKWTGLLHDIGHYAGYPERDKDGKFVSYASGFETTWHITPMDRGEYHAAARIEFYFKMPFDSTSINPHRAPFTFWQTFKFLSDFNSSAMEYMNKECKK